MISIAKGRSRTVILIPFLHIAIKIARTNILWYLYRFLHTGLFITDFEDAFHELRLYWKMGVILGGLEENLSEWSTWCKTKSLLLVPTYLSLGFVNVMKLAEGKRPEGVLWFQQISLITEGESWVSCHTFGGHKNFVIDDGGKIHMLDYGGWRIQAVIQRFGDKIFDKFDYSRVMSTKELKELSLFEEQWQKKQSEQHQSQL